MKHYVAHLSESGDQYYIPADDYHEEIEGYQQALRDDDWARMEDIESGSTGWITEDAYLELLGLS